MTRRVLRKLCRFVLGSRRQTAGWRRPQGTAIAIGPEGLIVRDHGL